MGRRSLTDPIDQIHSKILATARGVNGTPSPGWVTDLLAASEGGPCTGTVFDQPTSFYVAHISHRAQAIHDRQIPASHALKENSHPRVG
jgi:hypothetical protein